MSKFSRFVSIDLETTGFDEKQCQIVEVGAVIDDWLSPLREPPEFHCYVKREIYKGQPYALSQCIRRSLDASRRKKKDSRIFIQAKLAQRSKHG